MVRTKSPAKLTFASTSPKTRMPIAKDRLPSCLEIPTQAIWFTSSSPTTKTSKCRLRSPRSSFPKPKRNYSKNGSSKAGNTKRTGPSASPRKPSRLPSPNTRLMPSFESVLKKPASSTPRAHHPTRLFGASISISLDSLPALKKLKPSSTLTAPSPNRVLTL